MRLFFLFCAVLILFSAPAAAQSVGFGVQGDVVNFNFAGTLKEVYSLGYGGGVHLDLNLPLVSLRLSGDYVTLTPDKEKYKTVLQQYIGSAAAGVTVDGLRIDVISANLNLKLSLIPLPVVTIYATGGGGIVYLKATDATVLLNGVPVASAKAPEPQTKPALNAGAGVDFKLGPLTVFGELKINWILTEGETSTMVPLATAGITF